MIVLQIVGWILLGILAIVLGLLVLIFLLSLVSAGARVSYYEGALKVQAQYGFLRFTVYPQKEKAKKEKKEPKKTEDPPQEGVPPEAVASEEISATTPPELAKEPPTKQGKARGKPQPKEKKSLRELLEMGTQMLGGSKKALLTLKRHLIVDKLWMVMVISGEDAHKAGLNIARHETALANLLALLGELVTVKIRKIILLPDFITGVSHYDLEGLVRIRPIWLLKAGVHLLWSLLKIKRMEQTKNKGGMYHERKTTASE